VGKIVSTTKWNDGDLRKWVYLNDWIDRERAQLNVNKREARCHCGSPSGSLSVGTHGQLSPAPINSDSDSPGSPAECNTGPERHSANNNLLDFYFLGPCIGTAATSAKNRRRDGVVF